MCPKTARAWEGLAAHWLVYLAPMLPPHLCQISCEGWGFTGVCQNTWTTVMYLKMNQKVFFLHLQESFNFRCRIYQLPAWSSDPPPWLTSDHGTLICTMLQILFTAFEKMYAIQWLVKLLGCLLLKIFEKEKKHNFYPQEKKQLSSICFACLEIVGPGQKSLDQ